MAPLIHIKKQIEMYPFAILLSVTSFVFVFTTVFLTEMAKEKDPVSVSTVIKEEKSSHVITGKPRARHARGMSIEPGTLRFKRNSLSQENGFKAALQHHANVQSYDVIEKNQMAGYGIDKIQYKVAQAETMAAPDVTGSISTPNWNQKKSSLDRSRYDANIIWSLFLLLLGAGSLLGWGVATQINQAKSS